MHRDCNLPPIKMAEVFIDGNCIGFLSNVTLSREDDGAYRLEGDWSGFSDILNKDRLFTICIPRYDFRFLSEKVEIDTEYESKKITFAEASFIPDGPDSWLNTED